MANARKVDAPSAWPGLARASSAAGGVSPMRIARHFLTDVVRLGAGAVALFWCAGTIDWWAGWAEVALVGAANTAMGLIAVFLHPNLVAERMGARKSDKPWDVAIYFLIRVVALAFFVVGGLDMRFGWTRGFPPWLQLASLVASALGYALFLWAMAANKDFTIVVRISPERGHTVAAGGPYRFVRHPGYAGLFVSHLFLPLVLGSWWALVAGAVGCLLLVVRTALEDRALVAELPGYAEYAQRVRHRLLPGLW